MKTPQINTDGGSNPRMDCLIDDTLTEIRFLFDVDHAFPQKLEHHKEVIDAKPQGWWQRFRNWLLRGCSVRRANLAASVCPKGKPQEGGEGPGAEFVQRGQAVQRVPATGENAVAEEAGIVRDAPA